MDFVPQSVPKRSWIEKPHTGDMHASRVGCENGSETSTNNLDSSVRRTHAHEIQCLERQISQDQLSHPKAVQPHLLQIRKKATDDLQGVEGNASETPKTFRPKTSRT